MAVALLQLSLWSERHGINRPAARPALRSACPGGHRLLFPLAIGMCLAASRLTQTCLRKETMTELAQMTHGRSNAGLCWRDIAFTDLTCPQGASLTPALAHFRGPDLVRHPPPRTPCPQRKPQAGVPARWCHRLLPHIPLKTTPVRMRETLPTMKQSQAAGATPAWTWPAQPWSKPLALYWGCTDFSLAELNFLQTANWEARLADYAATCDTSPGRTSAAMQESSWMEKISHDGRPSSTGPRMSSGRIAAMPRQLTNLLTRQPFGRSRSHCTVRFQLLKSLHPLGPPLKLIKKPPVARCPCRTTCSQTTAHVPTAAPAGTPSHKHHRLLSSRSRVYRYHKSLRRSRAGPKSGISLNRLITYVITSQANGARVALAATAGAGSTSVEKLRGEAPQHSVAPLPKHIKRAYKRACNRASRSELGGTWYRGQWQILKTLGCLPKPPPPVSRKVPGRAQTASNNDFKLQVLSWNASGLSSSVYQEFMAWLAQQDHYHVVIVQETHWSSESDYTSGPWLCMHSSGLGATPADRSSGVLILLSRQHFVDAALREPVPGRVLQVQATAKRSGLPLPIVGVYQHVWRTSLTTVQNLELRRTVWRAIADVVRSTPQRHHLLIAGDFNANLTAQHPHVGGASTPLPASNHSPELQQLLSDERLCALNTWHAGRHKHTYVAPDHRSQIDFVITRCTEARGRAKHCSPLTAFPVAGWRQAGHRPLQAELWLRPFGRTAPVSTAPQPRCHLEALQNAVASQTEPALAMQQYVEERVQQLPPMDANSLQATLNHILWHAAEHHFPYQPGIDRRIYAQPQYKASARHTWDLYARLKLPGRATIANVWAKWRLLTAFRRASKALTHQSKILKRAFYDQQIEEAESAAKRGDQRTLHMIVKRLAPRSHKTVSRLQDPQGRLLGAAAEMQAIMQHGQSTFASLPDIASLLLPSRPLQVAPHKLQQELRALKLRKAVPQHIAPAAVWRQCSHCLGACLAQALTQHFSPPAQQPLQADWRDCYIRWLPKPNKKPVSVDALRPIGLQCPSTKALAGTLKQQLLDILLPAMASLPQFAYLKQRGTIVKSWVAKALSASPLNRRKPLRFRRWRPQPARLKVQIRPCSHQSASCHWFVGLPSEHRCTAGPPGPCSREREPIC